MNENPEQENHPDSESKNQPGAIEKPTEQDWLHIGAELAEKYFTNQAAQTELQRENLSHSYQYASEVVQAQVKDRENERTDLRKARRDRMFFAAFIIVTLAGFLVYALQTDKDQIALEIIKTIAFLGAGGLGGYAIGRYKAYQETDKE
jgi:hypothetical protein